MLVLLLLYLALVTVPLMIIDLRSHRLPNKLVLPGYAVLLVAIFGIWWQAGEFPWLALAATAGYFVFLYLLAWLGGMGMGDVKLAGVLGGASGLISLQAVMLSPVLAFLLAGLVSLVVWALTRTSKTRIPFGPFLLAGFWLALALSYFQSSAS